MSPTIDLLQFLLLGFIAYVLWQQHNGNEILPTKKGRKVVLDTCALIDGRIVELARAGFVAEELVIPEFILHELQLLADGVDAHKRSRARFGLDVVGELQDEKGLTVTIDRTKVPEKQATDDKLVALAKRLSAVLYTTDYNLGKVASIEGVKVLNVNELAQHLRPTVLPGEVKSVRVIQRGSNPKQGIGYLEDGTLIVVEGGAGVVGDLVEVEVTKAHQTQAGKMLFGQLVNHRRQAAKKTAVPRIAARRRSVNNVGKVSARLKRKVS